jgi:SMC interacting uncharacterized protein involved in chromosome segregation
MVAHVNDVTTAVEARLEELTSQMTVEFDDRLASLVSRVDEVAAKAARQQTDVTNLVADRVDRVEDRVNDRMLSLESRVNEEIGARVAEIDARVGRANAAVDESVATLNDRIGGIDVRFAEFQHELATVEERIKSVDAEAIEELKEQLSTAAGEAMLVRIEMERLDKHVKEEMDKTAVRMADLETTIQDATMDVETAVQLERLEEVERAIILLDPSQFVRHSDLDGATSERARASSPAEGGSEQPPSFDSLSADFLDSDAPRPREASTDPKPEPFTPPSPDSQATNLQMSRPS